MTRNEAVNWLINVTADIGKIEHRDLWHYEQALSEIKEMLEESADVTPVRHGHWEECEVLDENCVEVCQSARCSICGRYHTTPYMYYFDQYKYCPNCGARMDGEE